MYTQEPKLLDLVHILPETGVDLVGVEGTARRLAMLHASEARDTYKRWTSGQVSAHTNST